MIGFHYIWWSCFDKSARVFINLLVFHLIWCFTSKLTQKFSPILLFLLVFWKICLSFILLAQFLLIYLYLCFPAPGPNLYLAALALYLYFTASALNLHLPAPELNLCSPALRFTVKVCYSYIVYLYKLSVYFVLTC